MRKNNFNYKVNATFNLIIKIAITIAVGLSLYYGFNYFKKTEYNIHKKTEVIDIYEE